MGELVLVVRIGGQRVAIPTARVEAVVEVETLAPVPRAAPHVAGLAALRSRVLTAIDCAASLDPSRQIEDRREAVMTVVDGHPYALLVELVEDVVEASAPIVAPDVPLEGGWSRIASGVVEADGDLLLVVDVEALIAGPAAQAA